MSGEKGLWSECTDKSVSKSGGKFKKKRIVEGAFWVAPST